MYLDADLNLESLNEAISHFIYIVCRHKLSCAAFELVILWQVNTHRVPPFYWRSPCLNSIDAMLLAGHINWIHILTKVWDFTGNANIEGGGGGGLSKMEMMYVTALRALYTLMDCPCKENCMGNHTFPWRQTRTNPTGLISICLVVHKVSLNVVSQIKLKD